MISIVEFLAKKHQSSKYSFFTENDIQLLAKGETAIISTDIKMLIIGTNKSEYDRYCKQFNDLSKENLDKLFAILNETLEKIHNSSTKTFDRIKYIAITINDSNEIFFSLIFDSDLADVNEKTHIIDIGRTGFAFHVVLGCTLKSMKGSLTLYVWKTGKNVVAKNIDEFVDAIVEFYS